MKRGYWIREQWAGSVDRRKVTVVPRSQIESRPRSFRCDEEAILDEIVRRIVLPDILVGESGALSSTRDESVRFICPAWSLEYSQNLQSASQASNEAEARQQRQGKARQGRQ
jgi:hypothetical protein